MEQWTLFGRRQNVNSIVFLPNGWSLKSGGLSQVGFWPWGSRCWGWWTLGIHGCRCTSIQKWASGVVLGTERQLAACAFLIGGTGRYSRRCLGWCWDRRRRVRWRLILSCGWAFSSGGRRRGWVMWDDRVSSGRGRSVGAEITINRQTSGWWLHRDIFS